MAGWLKKVGRNIRMFFIGFFYGMKGADDKLLSPVSSDGEEVNKKVELGGNVYQEMLNQQETQQVKETRDANYRVYREADKYEVSVTGMGVDSDKEELHAKAIKKGLHEKPRTDLYETKWYKPYIVQDNKIIENDIVVKAHEAELGEQIKNADTNVFTIKYADGVLPRHRIENYLQKLVIRKSKSDKYRVDLYFSMYARQFYKQDSLFIAELHRIYDANNEKSDILFLDEISFVSNKAFGIDDLYKITLSGLKYKTVNVFDGNFVLEFDCQFSKEDLTEKYRTKELDEKYAKQAPKHDGIQIDVLMRHINGEKPAEQEQNYEKTTLKLTKDDNSY